MTNPLHELITELQAKLDELKAARDLNPRIDKLIEQELSRYPGAYRRDIVERTKIAPKAISRTLEVMQEQGQVVHIGEKRGSRWFLTRTLDELTKPH